MGIYLAGIQPQAHGATHILHIQLLRHQIDNGMSAFRSKFRAIGISHTANVAGKLNHSTLHTQANAEERNLLFASILNGLNFAFDTTVTKATGYQDAIHASHYLVHIGGLSLDFFSINPFNLQLRLVGDSCMTQGFGNTDISILQSHILANYGDGNLALVFFQHALYHIMPATHILGLVL